MVLWLVFCVFGKVAKVLNCLCFYFQFCLAFVGWLILVYLGLEGLGVFVVLVCVCVFFFCSGFAFVCFGFVFVLLLDCCWCCSCFFLSFVFFLFFLGGGSLRV